MSLNQELKSPRVRAMVNPRYLLIAGFIAAAILVAGCAAQSEPALTEYRGSAPKAPAKTAEGKTVEMTATEAAIAGMNEAPAADAQSAPTSTLLRPDAPMNYTVKRGDTLWDISAVFLRDPWFWPEIWQINPQVENPHLIYPGDTLSLAVGANGDAHVYISQYGGARLSPRLRSEEIVGPIDALPFAAISAFLSKPSMMTKDQALRAPHVLALRDHHMVGGTGHEIYVRNLRGQLNSRYSVMHVGEPVVDPETNDVVGYHAAFVATAVVNGPGEVTKAMLIEGTREAQEGDRLISQQGEVPLTFEPHAPPSRVDGEIIAVADGNEQIGQYQVVIINRGARHGLAAGAVLAVDQKGELVKDRFGKLPWNKDPFGDTVRLPYERAGTMIVFKVYDRVSYGLIIGARGPMRIADRVYNPEADAGARLMPASMTQYSNDGQAAPAPLVTNPGDGGTVVFFREKKMFGMAASFEVREGGVEICKLSNGRYCVVNVPAGAHVFAPEKDAKETLQLDVQPGATYFVRGTISMGFMSGRGNLENSDRSTFEALQSELTDNTGQDIASN
jgi:LysM repeat protein